jgi:hypothetical protein
MVCQDIADSLDNGVRTDAFIIELSKAFDSVPHDWLLKTNCGLRSGSQSSCYG